jgi:hypothetical protein
MSIEKLALKRTRADVDACALQQLHQSRDDRYGQEQKNGLQDPHNPRFIIYPFGHQPPHF